MENQARLVVYSSRAENNIQDIYDYGHEMFSPATADVFINELLEKTDSLSTTYLQYTECRFLPTKSQKYRMFNFYSYLIIYRITLYKIEVLLILHSKQSVSKIKSAVKIKV